MNEHVTVNSPFKRRFRLTVSQRQDSNLELRWQLIRHFTVVGSYKYCASEAAMFHAADTPLFACHQVCHHHDDWLQVQVKKPTCGRDYCQWSYDASVAFVRVSFFANKKSLMRNLLTDSFESVELGGGQIMNILVNWTGEIRYFNIE